MGCGCGSVRVQDCHSRTEEEEEEEATLSSFSADLQVLCNRSELPLPAPPASMLTPPVERPGDPAQLGLTGRVLPLTSRRAGPLLRDNFLHPAATRSLSPLQCLCRDKWPPRLF